MTDKVLEQFKINKLEEVIWEIEDDLAESLTWLNLALFKAA